MPTQTPPKREKFASTPRKRFRGVFVVISLLLVLGRALSCVLGRSNTLAAKVFSYTRVGVRATRVLRASGCVLARAGARVRARVASPAGLSVLAAAILTLTLAGSVAFHSTKTAAATASTVNFQAKLMTAQGAIAADGNYNVQFGLYNTSSGGSALWSEQYLNTNAQGVRVVNGYLTVNLGSVTPFPGTINWDQDLWVGMTVRGTGTSCTFASCTPADSEMTPRLKLTAVPYAFSAGNLSNVNGGVTSTLVFQGGTGGNQIFQLPDQGAAGTYNLLTTNAANGSFIQLQGITPGVAQNGNFNISGTGIAGILQSGQVSITASSGTVPSLAVQAASGQTANLAQFQDNSGNVNGSINATGNVLTLGRVASSGTVTQGKVVFADGTTDNRSLTLQVATQTIGNGTVTIPNVGGSSDQVCLQSLANCTGTGGGIAGSGHQYYVAYFDTFGGNHISDTSSSSASLYDNGSFLGLGTTTNSGMFSVLGSSASASTIFAQGAASATAATQTIKLASSQTGDLFQLDDNSGTALSGFGSNGQLYYMNSGFKLSIASPTLTANQTITLPNATGTVCLQGAATCGFAPTTGGTGYIQNQTAVAQAAGFNINGNGTIGGTLNVNGATLTNSALTFAAGAAGTVQSASGQTLNLVAQGAAGITLQTNGASRINVGSGGTVGIGTGSTSARLVIAAANNITPADGTGLRVMAGSVNDSTTTASGTAVLNGANAFEQNTQTATNTGVTTTNAPTVYIQGATIAGTNETLTNSYGLQIDSATSVAGAGTVQNAYGLSVQAPTGGTNNYAAIFQGGNVGVGTSSPVAALDVRGSATSYTGTGTISGTAGTASVTGVGTTFTAQLHTGDTITTSGGTVLQVGPIASDTALSLANGTSIGTTFSGQTFTYTQAALRVAPTVNNQGLIIQQAASPKANPFAIFDSTGAYKFTIGTSGNVIASGQIQANGGIFTSSNGGPATFTSGVPASGNVSYSATLQSGNTTNANSGNVFVASGNATTAGNSGNVSLDAGTAAGGTAGTANVGTTNASAVNIGHSGVTTTIQGSTSVTPQASTSTTLLCSNGGVLSTCDSSVVAPTASNFIQNQTASTQMAGFNISGNGYIGGNVGLGTTNPLAQLQLNGNAGVSSGAVTMTALNQASTFTTSASMTLYAGDYIIPTTSTSQARTVLNTVTGTTFSVLGGTSGSVYTANVSGETFTIYHPLANVVSQSGAGGLYIQGSTGRVGIGTAGTLAGLTVNTSGNIGAAAAASTGLDIAAGRIAVGSSLYSYGSICTNNGNVSCTAGGGVVLGATNTQASLNIQSNSVIQSTGYRASFNQLATPSFTTASTGTAYYYVITAYNQIGETIASTPLGMANNTSTLAWSYIPGEVGYKIYRNTTNSFTSGALLLAAVSSTAPSPTYTDTGAATTAGLPPASTTGGGLTIQGWAGQGNALQVLQDGSGQTGDLLQFQNSAGAATGGINSAGNLYYTNGGFTNVLQSAALTASQIISIPQSTAGTDTVCLKTLGNCAATGGSFIQNQYATVQAGNYNIQGVVGTVAATIQGESGGTADILDLKNSTGATVTTFGASGNLVSVASVANAFGGATTAGTILTVHPGVAGNVALALKGVGGQTGDLQQIQDVNGNILSGINANGALYTNGTANTFNALRQPAFTTASTGTAYYYEISATNANGETLPSAALGMANNTSALAWNQVAGATGYKIYRNTSNSFTSGSLLLTTLTNGTATSYTDAGSATIAGLPNGSPNTGSPLIINNYLGNTTFQVTPYGNFLETNGGVITGTNASAYCANQNTTLCLKASSITSVSQILQAASSQTADLIQYQDTNGDALSGVTAAGQFYSNGTGQIIGNLAVPSGVTSSTSPGTSFYYVVTATNAAGETLASTEVNGTASATTVSWTQVPGATGYKVYRGTSSGGEAGYFAITNGTTTSLANAQSASLTGASAPPTVITPGTGLSIQAWAGQTSNEIVVKDANANPLFNVLGNGQVGIRTGGVAYGSTLSIGTNNAGLIGQVIRGTGGQTADLLQLQDSSSNVLTNFDANGYIHVNRAVSATDNIFTGQVAGDSTNRIQIQANGQINFGSGSAAPDVSLSRSTSSTLNINGGLQVTGNTVLAYSGSGQGVSIGSIGTVAGQKLTVFTQSASNIGEAVRGSASQTADLLQLQNSSGTALSGFNASGQLYLGNTSQAGSVSFTDGTSDGYTASIKAKSPLAQSTTYNLPSTATSGTATFCVLYGDNSTNCAGTGGGITGGGTANQVAYFNGAGTITSSALLQDSGSQIDVNTATTADSAAQLLVSTGGTANKGLVVQGVAGQAANLLEVQSSTGAALLSVSSSGLLNVASDVVSNSGTFRTSNMGIAGTSTGVLLQSGAGVVAGANSGNVTIQSGNSTVSGNTGNITIDSGAATSGTAGTVSIGATNASAVTVGNANSTTTLYGASGRVKFGGSANNYIDTTGSSVSQLYSLQLTRGSGTTYTSPELYGSSALSIGGSGTGAGTIGLNTSGTTTPTMYLTGNNVGINTTSPVANLQVQASAGVSSGAVTMTAGSGTSTFTTSASMTLYKGDYIIPTTSTGQAFTVSTTATGTSFSVVGNYTANVSGETFTIYHPTENVTDASGNTQFMVQGGTGAVSIGGGYVSGPAPGLKLYVNGTTILSQTTYTPTISALAGGGTATISLASTGTTISRNVADANPALVVSQANAGSTGDIVDFSSGYSGGTPVKITYNGALVSTSSVGNSFGGAQRNGQILTVHSAATSNVAVVAQGISGQTADIFQIQDSSFNVQSGFNAGGNTLTIGNNTASGTSAGTIRLTDGTSDGFYGSIGLATIASSQTYTLPALGGTICIQASATCGFESTTGNDFIQNQTAVAQVAGFNVNGNGTIGGTLNVNGTTLTNSALTFGVAGAATVQSATNQNLNLSAQGTGAINLQTNGASRVTIVNSGLVGINTTSPSAWLAINGGYSGSPTSGGSSLSIYASSVNDSGTAASGTRTGTAAAGFGQSTLNATNTNVTTTSASNVYIQGATIAGTNETLTNSYGLQIDAANSLAGAGTVQNAYGLSVQAPTGAANNYAAIFQGGNVGIGTNSPAAALDVRGSATTYAGTGTVSGTASTGTVTGTGTTFTTQLHPGDTIITSGGVKVGVGMITSDTSFSTSNGSAVPSTFTNATFTYAQPVSRIVTTAQQQGLVIQQAAGQVSSPFSILSSSGSYAFTVASAGTVIANSAIQSNSGQFMGPGSGGGASVNVSLTSGPGSTSSGSVTLQSGNAGTGNSGNIIIDTGTSTSGTAGTVNIGTANASGVNIGTSSSTTTIAGNTKVTLNATNGTAYVCQNTSGYLSTCTTGGNIFGSGTANQVAYFNGAGTITSSSLLYDNGTSIGINNTSAANKLDINTATTADGLAQALIATGADTNKGLVIQGNSATQSADLLQIQNSAGTAVTGVTSAGNLYVNGTTLTSSALTFGAASAASVHSASGQNLSLGAGPGTNLTLLSGGTVGVGITSPTQARLQIAGGFSGSTGTGAALRVVAGTTNDLSTAASGTVALNAASGFEQNTLTAANTNVTTTNSPTLYIQGAMKAGTNQTITNSYGLQIDSAASVAGSGTVQNAYGLSVQAPAGATNNYAAIFQGGNVGIGTASPSAQLDAEGTATALTGTGTVSASTSTSTVTGSGTSFTTQLHVGDTMVIAGVSRSIAAIVSNTQLTLNGGNFPSNQTNVAFTYIQPVQRSAAGANQSALVLQAGSGVVYPLYVVNSTNTAGLFSVDTTGTARASAFYAGTFATDNGVSNTQNITIATGNSTVSGPSGNITISTGTAAGGNSGNISIDAGAATGGAGGTVNIGTANASSVSIGHNGATTAVLGAETVTGNSAGSSTALSVNVGAATNVGLSVTGAAGQTANLASILTNSGAGLVVNGSGDTISSHRLTVSNGGVNTASNVGASLAIAGGAANIGEVIQSSAGQTLDLLQLQGSDGSILNQFDVNGDISTNTGYISSPYGGLGYYQNLLGYSEAFDAPGWVMNNVTAPAANTVQAPNQTTTAENLADSASGGSASQTSTTAVGGTYTFSVWLKTSSGTQNASLRIDGSTGGTGTATNVTATTTWQRFWVTQNTSGFTGNVKVSIFPGGLAGNSAVQAWGAQLAAGTAPGVYATSGTGSSRVGTGDGLVTDNVSVRNALSVSTIASLNSAQIGMGTGGRLSVGTANDAIVGVNIQANSATQTANLFQLQDSSNNIQSSFSALGNQLTLGNNTASGTSQGKISLADGTADGFLVTLQSNTQTGNYQLKIPTLTANDTICTIATCGTGGLGSYINNGGAGNPQQTNANFNIVATAGTVNTIQGASGADVLDLNQNGGANALKVASNGDITAAGLYNTNTFTGSNLTFGAAGAATVQSATGQNLVLNAQGSASLNLQANGTTGININSSGVVGVGVSAGGARLIVSGAANGSAAGAGTSGLVFRTTAGTNNDSGTAANGTAANFNTNSFAQNTIAATNTNVTTTNSANLYIQGAPKAGTNEAITNSYGLQIDSASVAGGNGVQNSYGLSVQAQSGATNNYAAIFQGGNVGIGAANPVAALQVQSSSGVSSGAVTMTAANGTSTFTTSANMTLYRGDYIVPTTSTGQSNTVSAMATGTSFTGVFSFTANVTGETFTIYHPTQNDTDNTGTSQFMVQGNGNVSVGNFFSGAVGGGVKLSVQGSTVINGNIWTNSISNQGNPAYSLISFNATGTTISRNIADANAALTVSQSNAGSTGDIVDFKNSAATVGSISISGAASFNGTITSGTSSVAGSLVLTNGNGTNTTLNPSATTAQTFTLPATGGTLCTTTTCAAGGGSGYIANAGAGNTVQTNANFNVQANAGGINTITGASGVDILDLNASGGSGGNAFKVNSTGNAGIGSTAPVARLQVQANSGISSGAVTMTASSGAGTFTTSASLTLYKGDYIVPTTSTGQSVIVNTTATGTSFAAAELFSANVSGETFTIYHPTENVTDGSGNTQLLVAANGLVSVGGLFAGGVGNNMTLFNVQGTAAVYGNLFVPSVSNTTNTNNSLVSLGNTGTTISRNVADANAALTIAQQNAGSTGDIVDFANSGGTVALVDKTGNIATNQSLRLGATSVAPGTTKLYITTSTAQNAIVARGASGQTSDLIDLQDSSGNVQAGFSPTGNQLTLGNNTASGTSAGTIRLTDGTSDGFYGTLNLQGAITSNQTYSLPTTGGTLCIQSSASCGFAPTTGGTGYIQNTTTQQTNANFNIAATSGVAATIQGASGQGIVSFNNSSGTPQFAIDGNGATQIANRLRIFSSNTANILAVGNPTTVDGAAQALIATGGAANKGLVIQGAAGQTANPLEVQSSTGGQLFNVNSVGTVNAIADYASGSGIFRTFTASGASTNSTAATLQSGNVSGATSNSGTVTVTSGNSTTSGNTGNIIIDAGAATSGTNGSVSIGTTNASSVSIGRTGVITGVAGTLAVSGVQTITASAGGVGLSVQGAAGQDIADFKANGGSTVFSLDSAGQAHGLGISLTNLNGSGNYSQISGTLTNSNTTAAPNTVSGYKISLAGTSNTTGGTPNTSDGLNFAGVTAQTGNTFNGIVFQDASYNSILNVAGTSIINGSGVLQSAGLSGSYTGSVQLNNAADTFNGLSVTTSGAVTAGSVTTSTLDAASGNTLSLGTTNATGVTIGRGATTTTIQGTTSVTLQTSTSTTLVCGNSGVLSTCDASVLAPTAANFIQNQNSATQTGTFKINGSGTLGGLLTANAGVTVSGALTQTGGAVSLTGNAASSFTTSAGGITIDTAAAGNTIAIGNGAVTHTIQIGTGAAVQTVTIGSTNGSSTTNIQAGAAGLINLTGNTTVSGAIAQTVSTATGSAFAQTITGTATSGTNTVNAQNINLTGTATSGTNTVNALNLASVTAVSGNTFNGITIGSNYNAALIVGGTTIINGSGVLQSAGLSGTYSNALTLSSAANAYSGATINLTNTSAATTANISTNTNPTTSVLVVNNTNASASGNLIAAQNNGTNKFTVDASGNVAASGTLTYANSGAAATAQVCKDGSGYLTACSTTGTGASFVQGGNSFGSKAILGTKDSNGLQIITGGADGTTTRRAYFDTSNNLYLGNADNTGTANSPSSFTITGTGGATAGIPGGALSIQGGAGTTTGAGSAGGNLNLSGGTANGTGNNNGGSISLQGGAGSGTNGYGNIALQQSGGEVSIGTSAGSAKLTVLSLPFSGVTDSTGIVSTVNPINPSNNGIAYTGIATTVNATSNVNYGGNIDGVSSWAAYSGTGTATAVYGVQSAAKLGGTGTGSITTAYGLYSQIQNNNTGGGTIGTAYGLYVDNPVTTGTITNNYAAAFLGGNVGIGTATPSGLLTVGSGNKFTVDANGNVVTVGSVTTSTLDAASGNALNLGTANATTVNIGNSSGATFLNGPTGARQGLAVTTATASNQVLMVEGASGQTGDLLQLQNNSSQALAGFSANGNLYVGAPSTGAAVTGNITLYNSANANNVKITSLAQSAGNGTLQIPDLAGTTQTIALASDTTNFIRNQTSQQASANFNISGTGKAAGFDATSGALAIGGTTATGITVGNTTNTATWLVQGTNAATYTIGTSTHTGSITLGNSQSGETVNIATGTNATGTNTVNIGNAAGNGGTAAIFIGNSTTAGSTSNITVGSTVAGATTLQSAGGTTANYAGTGNALTVAGTGNGTNLSLTSTAVTTASLLNISQNTAAYTGTAIKVNIANGSGSFASGKFIDFQTNGTSKFNVDANGVVTVNGGQTADIKTSGATALSLDTGGAAAINIGGSNASQVNIGRASITTAITGVATITNTTASTTLSVSSSATPSGNNGVITANSTSGTGTDKLLSLQKSGTPQFTVDANGNVVALGTLKTGSTGQFQVDASGNLSTTGSINTSSYYEQAGNIVLNTITGTNNIFVGNQSGNLTTSGSNNFAAGSIALSNLTGGVNNVATGASGLLNTTTGNNNAAYGQGALQTNTNGTSNTGLGYHSDVGSGNLQNATAVGANAYVTASNSLVLGCVAGTNGCATTTNVGIGNSAPAGLFSVGSSSQFQVDVNGNLTTSGNATAANFKVTAGTGTFDTATAGALNIGTTNATSIVMGNGSTTAITVQSAGTTAIQSGTGTSVKATTDNSSAFSVQNSSGASQLSVDTTNTAAGQNLATNGGVESGTTNWSGFGGVTPVQTTAAGQFAAGAAALSVPITAANQGAKYNLTLTSGTLYNVSFSVKSSSGTPTFSSSTIFYSTNGTSSAAACAPGSYDSGSIASKFVKYTCTFTATSSASAYVVISQGDATARSLYIDNLSVVAQNTTGTQDTGVINIGGGASGQGLTLLKLDTYGGTPFTSVTNGGTAIPSLAGAMYFDTTAGKMQCYDGNNWGACGAAPNSIITLAPEYANAVLHSSGSSSIGTLTSDICSDALHINDGTSGQPSICGSNQTYNFYRWTSVQPSAQQYSLYVTYQLPSTFKNFINGSTSLVAKTDSSNSTVAYTIYRNHNGTLTTCSVSQTVSTGAQTNWQTGAPTTDPSSASCGFTAGDSMLVEIDVVASNSANAYVGNLNFTYSNQ